MDDNKVSHVDDDAVTKAIDDIEAKFFGELVCSTGKKHTFLGMDKEFIGDGKVAITTPQHIREMVEDFPEELTYKVVNPARNELFTVVVDAKKLDNTKTEIFRKITAKGLWISKRSRPDLETAISFLCTRV